MDYKIKKLRNKVEQKKGARDKVRQQLTENRLKLRNFKDHLILLEQSREVLRDVGLRTQQELQFHISDITSLALSAVFEEPYELKVEFVERRNKIECDLLFERNGEMVDPLDSSGYGAVDIASFALRVASWSMMFPKSRNTIILDEPFKFLDKERQPAASQMLKELSDKLGIQFIIVTHEDILTQYADKVFQVKIKEGISKVE